MWGGARSLLEFRVLPLELLLVSTSCYAHAVIEFLQIIYSTHFLFNSSFLCFSNSRSSHSFLHMKENKHLHFTSWPRVSDQILRYFADRTGIISTANLPLIWAFGIRNNTLLWLTGWDFATYNNFHRWVARVSTLEAVLHSLAYTVMIVAGMFVCVRGVM